MLLEMAIVFAVGAKTTYESVNKSEKLYSENAVQTVKGAITDTKTVTLKDGAEFMQMDVETDHGTVAVHLGPTWYMNEYADRFDVNKGRSVSVIGSSSTVQGKEVLVASELANEEGNNTCAFGILEASRRGSAVKRPNSITRETLGLF